MRPERYAGWRFAWCCRFSPGEVDPPATLPRMNKVRVAVAVAAAAGALAGCGGVTTSTPPITRAITQAPASGSPIPSGPLDLQEACQAFLQVTADYTLDDKQSFEEYSDVADRTQDPALSAAIRAVATGFEEHQADISDVQVQQLC